MSTETALSILIKSAIDTGLIVRGLTATVKQDNQPRQQGILSTPTIFFHRVSYVNVGWLERKNAWNQGHGNFDHTEIQRRESRYQINALVPQSPNTSTTLPTAADYLLSVAAILQSDSTIDFLQANKVGVQHITGMTSTFFKDEKDQFEDNPSFDVVFSHQDVFTTAVPKIDEFNPNVGVV